MPDRETRIQAALTHYDKYNSVTRSVRLSLKKTASLFRVFQSEIREALEDRIEDLMMDEDSDWGPFL